jgi:hypothetical protein
VFKIPNTPIACTTPSIHAFDDISKTPEQRPGPTRSQDVNVWFFAPGLFGAGTASVHFACNLCFKLPAKPMRLGGRHQISRAGDVLDGAPRRAKFGWRMKSIA